MRVPDLTATAGYAASSINHNNYKPDLHNYSSSTLSQPQPQQQPQYSAYYADANLSQVFSESAQDFVDRALSSASYRAPTTTDSQTYLHSYNATSTAAAGGNNPFYEDCIKTLIDERAVIAAVDSASGIRHSAGDSFEEAEQNDNTYRSFKEVLNISKSIFDSSRDLENYNQVDEPNYSDIDPIQIINSTQHHYLLQQKQEQQPQPTGLAAATARSFAYESGQQHFSSLQNTEDAEAEYAYEDEPMLDLENISNAQTAQQEQQPYTDEEELEDYSSSSSSISLRTPRHLYFPRGIINPNYPGFQHLAHTLSEHFVSSNTNSSDTYDSDLSEMELSADSFDDLSEVFNNKLKSYCGNNSYSNNYNNNNISSQQHNNNAHGMLPLEIEARQAAGQHDSQYSETGSFAEFTEHNTANYLCDTNQNANISDKSPLDICSLPHSLDTVLVLNGQQLLSPKGTNAPEQHQQQQQPCSTTPDIIRKNPPHKKAEQSHLAKKENRPDLLRGVSPHNDDDNFDNCEPSAEQILPQLKHKLAYEDSMAKCLQKSFSSPMKEETYAGITPVDIIGDFGEEVEREFGLLVSGYRRLIEADTCSMELTTQDKMADATLSIAHDEINTSKYLTNNYHCENSSKTIEPADMEDNNAVDWFAATNLCSTNNSDNCKDQTSMENENENENDAIERKQKFDFTNVRPKYQKPSYDERHLAPVAIEYKPCQKPSKKPTAIKDNVMKKAKLPGTSNKFLNSIKRSCANGKSERATGSLTGLNRKRCDTNDEISEYHQLISNKEQILNNSKYTKLSSWAQYLKDSVPDRDLLSPSALDLFDAYKIGGDADVETLQQHLQMAKEIEKKRRSDREEIRRRLAMGAEEFCSERKQANQWRPSLEQRLNKGIMLNSCKDFSSDSEYLSSDSETCPKLSKMKVHKHQTVYHAETPTKATHPYNGRPLSVSLAHNKIQPSQSHAALKQLQPAQQLQQQPQFSTADDEPAESDFFTKQARLQIEARMALVQAKEMAHMQMEFERQNQRECPITSKIRGSLEKVGVQLSAEKRRVSRQLLTNLNIAQLQVLVNGLHTHIEDLNGSLVHFLMERDELHMSQDTMLVDIEELTRYIGTKEHLLSQQKSNFK